MGYSFDRSQSKRLGQQPIKQTLDNSQLLNRPWTTANQIESTVSLSKHEYVSWGRGRGLASRIVCIVRAIVVRSSISRIHLREVDVGVDQTHDEAKCYEHNQYNPVDT